MKKKSKGLNLSDFIEITPREHRTFRTADSIAVGFQKGNSRSHRVRLRIGRDILAKMKWSITDKIAVLYRKDKPNEWLLCKAESGYKLGKYCNKKPEEMRHFIIQFSWGLSLFEKYLVSKKVKFEIHSDKILLTL